MSTQRKSTRIQLKAEKQRAECLSEPEAPTTLPSSISVTSNKPPPRPSNSFICYRSWALREGLLKNITSSQVELSKLIGKQWGAMTAAQKRPFVVKARELKAARITALELGSLNVGGHSSNHRVPCEVKTKSTSNSRNENRLQVTNIRPAFYDRIEPQFAGAEEAEPIFPTALELESCSSSSGSETYYPSLGKAANFSPGVNTDHCSETALGNGSIPVDFDRLISSKTSDNFEQSTCIEEISEEESKLMEEYFNWGQE